MANKYIRHGETYCGDGTTSAAAASDGGVGAWNNINVFEGTAPAYGALAAGDVVYMRSKDAGGANITRTVTSDINIGSSAASEPNPITWVLDNGSVWSGNDGVLSYQYSGGNRLTSILAYNNVVALTPDAVTIVSVDQWGYNSPFLKCNNGNYVKNLKLDVSAQTNECSEVVRTVNAVMDNFTLIVGNLTGTSAVLSSEGYNYGESTYINPIIEVRGTDISKALFYTEPYQGGQAFTVIGGRIFGTAADAGAVLVRDNSTRLIRFIGTLFPRTMQIATSQNSLLRAEVVGCDADGTGGYLAERWGWATSRTDNYPPTLSATLPNTTLTPWAWRVYPRNAATSSPMRLVASKIYTDSAAIKTITQEILVATTMTVSKASVWMTVEYIDNATGLPKHVDTRDFAAPALDASTANWSATTWGMVNFSKRKLSVTTPTSIKPNTLVTVTLFGVVKSATADDIYFVDPDFAVM